MAKKLIRGYTFDASEKKVTVPGIYNPEQFLLITEMDDGAIIFQFNCEGKGVAAVTYDYDAYETTITLDYDTTSLTDSTRLQIYVDYDYQSVDLKDTLVDPVSKIRVSNPENLIDTDFEYGLQSSKWETLELIRNIPTVFSRNGDTTLEFTDMVVTSGSSTVVVTTPNPHNITAGTPLIIQGATNNLSNGGFVVNRIIDDNTFSFVAKATFEFSGSVSGEFTDIFLGSIYQGTEFKLNGLRGITTDGATPSTLTVETAYPIGFQPSTSFVLSNSVGQKNVTFDSTATTYDNFRLLNTTVTQGDATLPSDTTEGWQLGPIGAYDWRPKHSAEHPVKWFVQGTAANATITVNTTAGVETITFTDSPHGFTDGQTVAYCRGYGNGLLGGLTESRWYWVRVVDDYTIYLTLGGPTSTVRVNLTSAGTTTHVHRSCFATCYVATAVNTVTEEMTFGERLPYIEDDPSQLMANLYTTNGGLYITSNTDNWMSWTLASGVFYYPYSVTLDGSGNSVVKFTLSSAGGALTNLNSATINGAIVMMEPDPLANCMYLEDHGLVTGDVVRFQTNRGASYPPGGLTHNNYYRIQYVTDNWFSLWRYDTATPAVINNYSNYASSIYTWYGNIYVDDSDYLDCTQVAIPPASSVTYAVTISGGKYYLTGTEAPALTLTEGNTYTFDLSDPTNTGETFSFSTTSDGTHGGGTAYTTGVTLTGTPGTSGCTVVFVVPSSAPDLYYYGSATSGLGNAATTPAPTATNIGHNLSDGDQVIYSDEGGTTIAGLTDGGTYYVADSTEFKLRLATSSTGYDDVDFTIENTASGDNVIGYVVSGTYIRKNGHGLVTGDRVQYFSDSPINGLRNGGFYYVYVNNANYFYINFTYAGAVANTGYPDRVIMSYPYSGTSRFVKTTIADITAAGTGDQSLAAQLPGASDGVYTLSTNPTDTTFTFQAANEVPLRVLPFTSLNAVYIEESALRIPDHYLRTGYAVTFDVTSGTAPSGLTDATTYYVIRTSRNWIQLAATESDAVEGTAVTITDRGDGNFTLTTDNLIGEVLGQGTLDMTTGSTSINGTNTNFSAFFKTGDTVAVYAPESSSTIAITSAVIATDIITTATHGYTTEDAVRYIADTPMGGLSVGNIYYVRVLSATTLTLHPTAADATANTNIVDITTTTGAEDYFIKITDLGATYINTIAAVAAPTYMEFTTSPEADVASAEYAVSSSLIVRADGAALHRPYDGGVELIPPSNPDSMMVRQTRRYFRYQSGKGIQVSFAINFSPSVQIERITTNGTSTAVIHTRFPHRLTEGVSVNIFDVPLVSGTDYFNGDHTITTITDEYQFQIELGTYPGTAVSTGGFGSYVVNSWSNCALRCGLFDDQNGMYFEYDGSNLKVCRRKSIKQLSGQLTVTFNEAVVTGTNTKFTSQISVGDYIVIRGQSYLVVKISSDTTLYISPSYRGASSARVIGTLTENIKVPQSQWNLDKCDGTGRSGYYLDIHKIQMAYIDYSWYGAGKIRFGFRTADGDVRYVHQFVHNNEETEAYMRTGNVPARYDVQNLGTPTYVPALAHWGTSVIMDGGFDPDEAYIFNASSSDLQLTGEATLTVSAKVDYLSTYYGYVSGRVRNIGYALLIAAPVSTYAQVANGMAISGAGLAANTLLRNPIDGVYARNPYQPDILARKGYGTSGFTPQDLLVLDRAPTTIAGANSNYTVTLASAGAAVVYDVPVLTIRLAPSVDSGIIGSLGEREIVNRMQLILRSVEILSTHACEVSLRLNGQVNNLNWTGVRKPSLSQLIYHLNGDLVSGGLDIYTFRAQGGVGTTGRQPVLTSVELGDVAYLGNSIMGGDNAYPDGPDQLTVVVRLTEDPSTVSSTNPFTVSGRINWTESQA